MAVEGDAVRAARVAEACQVLRRLWAGDRSDFAGTHYRLARPDGFLRPDPPPPIVVGGFGPRMAEIAGRWADGFNTQARHPRLAELVGIARDAHGKAGRDPARFLVTVFAGLADGWLSAGSSPRAGLEALGVARLILLVPPPTTSPASARRGDSCPLDRRPHDHADPRPRLRRQPAQGFLQPRAAPCRGGDAPRGDEPGRLRSLRHPALQRRCARPPACRRS